MKEVADLIREFGSFGILAYLACVGVPSMIAQLAKLTEATTKLIERVDAHDDKMTNAHSQELLALFNKPQPKRKVGRKCPPIPQGKA